MDYKFNDYDHEYIAQLCESCNLCKYALENYKSLNDIKRVLHIGLNSNDNNFTIDYLIKSFETISPDNILSIIQYLYNIKIVVIKI